MEISASTIHFNQVCQNRDKGRTYGQGFAIVATLAMLFAKGAPPRIHKQVGPRTHLLVYEEPLIPHLCLASLR
jgi:hypothetical protein